MCKTRSMSIPIIRPECIPCSFNTLDRSPYRNEPRSRQSLEDDTYNSPEYVKNSYRPIQYTGQRIHIHYLIKYLYIYIKYLYTCRYLYMYIYCLCLCAHAVSQALHLHQRSVLQFPARLAKCLASDITRRRLKRPSTLAVSLILRDEFVSLLTQIALHCSAVDRRRRRPPSQPTDGAFRTRILATTYKFPRLFLFLKWFH